MKQYRFHRLASELILEPVTGQLPHYAPLSHFAPRYGSNGKAENFINYPGASQLENPEK